MSVRLSHTLCMEMTVHVIRWRSMYCVDMFPKIRLQTDTNFLHVVTCMQNFAHEAILKSTGVKDSYNLWTELAA